MKIPFEQFAYAVWGGIAEALRIVRLSPGTGTGQISLTAGAVTVGTNNDKTAYSLTAGSYSVRASSTQQVSPVASSSTSLTSGSTISSVTVTRISSCLLGSNSNSANADAQPFLRIHVSGATALTGARYDTSNAANADFEVAEFF